MEFRQLIRLNLKIIFWFLLLSYIFLFNSLKVNLSKQPNYDVVPVAKQKNISKDKLSVKIISHKNKNISPVQKRVFLLKLVISALKHKHASAISMDTYKKLCNYYSNWCDKIEVDDFSYQDKVYYTALSIYLFEFVNKYLPKLSDTLEYVKIQPDKNWRRWYAGHYSIIMNVRPNMDYKQFFNVLTHELGHIVDLGVLQGNGFIKSSKFTEYWKKSFYLNDPSLEFYKLSWLSEKIKKPTSYISDFVSWYWMTDPFEDFAESFNMYINHNFVFRQMATESNVLRKKYNFIAKLFKWNYLNSDKNFNYHTNFRPWDSTIMK